MQLTSDPGYARSASDVATALPNDAVRRPRRHGDSPAHRDAAAAPNGDSASTPQHAFAARLAAVSATGGPLRSSESLFDDVEDADDSPMDWGIPPPPPVRIGWTHEDDRPRTTLSDVEKLVRFEGPYAEAVCIRKVIDLWQTTGPGEFARPHYDKWQVAPNDLAREEHFYDALFQEFRYSGVYIDMVDQSLLDWKKTGRLDLRIKHRLSLHPDASAEWAQDDIRNSFLAWSAAEPDLGRWRTWHLISEADYESRRLAAKTGLPLGTSLGITIGLWDAWHERDRSRHRAALPEGQWSENDETRVLHKKLILKQLLDTQLAMWVEG